MLSARASEWINGLSSPTQESYHPNRRGTWRLHAHGEPLPHRLHRAQDLGRPHDGQEFPPRGWQTSSAGTGVDAGIEPEQVLAPDLTTPEARAAAARAGVDLSSRASIER